MTKHDPARATWAGCSLESLRGLPTYARFAIPVSVGWGSGSGWVIWRWCLDAAEAASGVLFRAVLPIAHRHQHQHHHHHHHNPQAACSLCLEWWIWELIVFLAGLLPHNTEVQLGAIGFVMQISIFTWTVRR